MEPFIQSPRAASHTRDSDITDTDWPVVTKSLLADHEKLESAHTPDQINQPLFALIKARKAIGDAKLACQFAKRMYKENTAVKERLDFILRGLSDNQQTFPLTMLENVPNRPRRHIMAGHDGASHSTPWGVE